MTGGPGMDADSYPAEYYWQRDGSLLSRLEELYRDFVIQDHVRFVRRWAPPGSVLLDVGCGSGTFLNACRKAGFRVRGLEGSPTAVEHARRVYALDVREGDLLSADLGGPYDVVTLFHVLEHVADPRRLLERVRCKYLMVQVPNGASLQARLFGLHWYGLDPDRHLFHFTDASLKGLVSECGFRVLGEKHFSLRDNGPALASSAFPWLDPLHRRLRGRASLTLELLYFALVALAQPLAWFEAFLKRGGTVMVAAVKES